MATTVFQLQNARQAGAHSIQLALRLQHGVSLQWQSDGGEPQTGDAFADEEFVIRVPDNHQRYFAWRGLH